MIIAITAALTAVRKLSSREPPSGSREDASSLTKFSSL
jgi:hypothetical protein